MKRIKNLIDNQTLFPDALDEFGPFSEPLLRRYLGDIVCGLAYLHDKHLIHRDIKPSNLLLDKGIVKLADFGCSKISEKNEGSSNQGTLIGTTIYMSPEVMAEKHYGRKSDIWSLGVTMVEMTTGKAPFRTAAAAIYSICVSKELPTLPQHMSQDSHVFLSRCIVENSKLRASCQELSQMDFLCKVLTSEQNMSLTRSSHYMSSSISLNPISGFKPAGEESDGRGQSKSQFSQSRLSREFQRKKENSSVSIGDSKTDQGDMFESSSDVLFER